MPAGGCGGGGGGATTDQEEWSLSAGAGTRVGFLQDAVSVELPETEGERGKMTMLGHVKQRLVVTPNWDHLMDNSGLCSTLA